MKQKTKDMIYDLFTVGLISGLLLWLALAYFDILR